MFKPTIYSEIQRRKKLMIGMHLVELSDRYHYFNVVTNKKQLHPKKTSFSQHSKPEIYPQKQLVTLPVTPKLKLQQQLLVSKKVTISPRQKMSRPNTKGNSIQQKFFFNNKVTQELESKPDTLVVRKDSIKNKQSNRKLFDIVNHTTDYDDFIEYVFNNKQI